MHEICIYFYYIRKMKSGSWTFGSKCASKVNYFLNYLIPLHMFPKWIYDIHSFIAKRYLKLIKKEVNLLHSASIIRYYYCRNKLEWFKLSMIKSGIKFIEEPCKCHSLWYKCASCIHIDIRSSLMWNESFRCFLQSLLTPELCMLLVDVPHLWKVSLNFIWTQFSQMQEHNEIESSI